MDTPAVFVTGLDFFSRAFWTSH